MTDRERELFDEILDWLIRDLPVAIYARLEEVPVVVEDEPPRHLLLQMGLDPRYQSLCGLHWGIPLTQRSVEHSGTLPDQITLFRGPILAEAGWHARRRSQEERMVQLTRQIRITLLHEIGHHFGLGEDDLAALGYG